MMGIKYRCNKAHYKLRLFPYFTPYMGSGLVMMETRYRCNNAYFNWEAQLAYLASSWVEKGTKLKEFKIAKNQQVDKIWAPSEGEKGTKLPNKKLCYLTTMLMLLGTSLSIDELMDVFGYKDKGKFRQNYLKPLEMNGFVQKTNPEKPTASNQKYLITEQGKRFLAGREF
jgi:hypothetical protein